MIARDYNIMHCKDGNLYINFNNGADFRSDDSKCLSNEDLGEIESWIKQNNKYVCKDDFIKKACEYLMEYEFNDSPTIADRRKRVEYFKKYMED